MWGPALHGLLQAAVVCLAHSKPDHWTLKPSPGEGETKPGKGPPVYSWWTLIDLCLVPDSPSVRLAAAQIPPYVALFRHPGLETNTARLLAIVPHPFLRPDSSHVHTCRTHP